MSHSASMSTPQQTCPLIPVQLPQNCDADFAYFAVHKKISGTAFKVFIEICILNPSKSFVIDIPIPLITDEDWYLTVIAIQDASSRVIFERSEKLRSSLNFF